MIATTYQTLMTVQLKIKNAVETTSLTLSFNEPNYLFVSSYTTIATTKDNNYWFMYDNPVFENIPSVLNSPLPIINSITSTATAGTGTLVVITGDNFGEANIPILPMIVVNHRVKFKSADYQGNGATVPLKRQEYCDYLNNCDYVTWSTSRIEIRLPSFVWHNGGPLTPGSGRFYVRNDWGKETYSSSRFQCR